MITLSRILIWAWLVVGGAAAFAESYPVRPIKLIVPYPAGGGTDIAARWIGQMRLCISKSSSTTAPAQRQPGH
jgi:tripartite-type tricarboxylate transporter receptor subunit TctC